MRSLICFMIYSLSNCINWQGMAYIGPCILLFYFGVISNVRICSCFTGVHMVSNCFRGARMLVLYVVRFQKALAGKQCFGDCLLYSGRHFGETASECSNFTNTCYGIYVLILFCLIHRLHPNDSYCYFYWVYKYDYSRSIHKYEHLGLIIIVSGMLQMILFLENLVFQIQWKAS